MTPSAQAPEASLAGLLPVDVAVLARVWCLGDAGATKAKLRDGPKLTLATASTTALDESASAARDRLLDRGLAATSGTGRSVKLRCTADGVALLDELGIVACAPSGPGEKPPSWTVVRDLGLTALALGLRPPSAPEDRKRFKSVGGLRASVLNRHFGLDLGPFPSANAALHALAWQRLGRALGQSLEAWSGKPFGTGAGLCCLVGHEFGLRRVEPPGKLAALAAAAALQARGTDAGSLRSALWRDWARTTPSASADAATRQTATTAEPAADRHPPPPVADHDLLSWLRQRGPEVGRDAFGAGKVFVADLWRALQADHPDWFATAADFKQRLLQLARDRRLELVRADLVEAMDPATVAASEIRDLHATWHFVRLR